MAGGTPVVSQLASQMTVSGADINARPITRPGEIVEAAPGLMAIVHAEGGKANQYYLRGWNLDHGTDLATFVDDVPINLPTHAHGQGYTDLNWLIPETISGVDIRKGPFFSDVGDFANAGNLHISLRDSVERTSSRSRSGVSAPSAIWGWDRARSATARCSMPANSDLQRSMDKPEDVRKFSGLVRYSQGTATDGVSLTAAAYTNNWNSADQIPLRAVTTNQIPLNGELDPTDGGDTSRFSLSGRLTKSEDDGLWKANAYIVKYTMDLFNNYSWETTDPVNGDQFRQHDNRIYAVGVSRTLKGTMFSLPTETEVGVQTRYDDITLSLSNTNQRLFLANTLVDHIGKGRRHLHPEHHALDRLVQDHHRLARRCVRSVGQFDAAAGELGPFPDGVRQPEVHGDARSALQDRAVRRLGLGYPATMRAAR